MKIESKRLTEVSHPDLIALMTHSLVRRQMPLTSDIFGDAECDALVTAKERLWVEHGYSPWAFIVDGKFAGWGGLQPENGDADLAMVLHPDYWGAGKILYDEIIKKGFGEMGFKSITILFPPSRTRIKAILRLGFQPDGEAVIEGEKFIRYRLHSPRK